MGTLVVRAKINIQQTQIQAASMKRQVSSDVERAHLDCELSLHELSRVEAGSLAEAARLRDAAERDYLTSSSPGALQRAERLGALLLASSEHERMERRYVSILARYLRSSLDLNTAVGQRIMP